MKKNIALALIAVSLIGCGCQTANEVQCQPGWKVITTSDAEALNLRNVTGNDLTHTGRVVEITRPTSINSKR